MGGIFVHQTLNHSCDHIQFIQNTVTLTVNSCKVQQLLTNISAVFQQCFSVRQQFAECRYEMPLQVIFVQMRCAAGGVASVLGIALPDRPAVLAVGVPDFGTVVFTAVTADQLGGKGAVAIGAFGAVLPSRQFQLRFLPFIRCNDGFVAVFYIVLGNFALVDLHFLLQEIYCEFLLQERRAFIFFVAENAFHRSSLPYLFACRCGDVLLGQVFGNGIGGLSFNAHSIDGADNLRLLRHDLRQAVCTFAVSKKLAMGYMFNECFVAGGDILVFVDHLPGKGEDLIYAYDLHSKKYVVYAESYTERTLNGESKVVVNKDGQDIIVF